jgi:hypothetical protein
LLISVHLPKTAGRSFHASLETWLRDPIERLTSHYYYWVRDYNPKTAGKLRRRMVEENWTLEQFCFSKKIRIIHTTFFWGFPISRFDLVGITEN